ncbi:hypothetical protein AArcSl_1309 [Halalkaliarchaeum desulfuricum]|uniref:Uncharacterized protein n=1 Tax=Halalkaliarchaeum desulfuricum TaxID=2055893 RepID=A0A343TIL8_9EURY|nr:hypothetical protein [Halalkaliarchaeum desulfuricum]AUX08940.1 hypothetical protein AArcSl_1309 [Halalkaliarchaeum desulfuricum]
MGTKLTPVAFDVETTGFESDSTVTVLGLVLPLGCRVFLNAGGRPADRDRLERELETEFDAVVRVSCHRNERELLAAVAEFVAESIADDDYMLVAYNGELYRGGFDLPFLRTRCALLDCRWPFDGVPYADLLPIFRARFNTTVDEEQVNDLEGAYQALIGDGLTALDPFADSREAVAAFERGEFRPLLAHNLADILRTDALAGVAQRYCGTSEFDLKSLTPTLRDPSLTGR